MTGKLKFNKRKHEYTINGRRLVSVTQFVDLFFNKFDERAKARELAKLPQFKKAKKGVKWWLAEWKRARDDGTIVHEQIQHYVNNKVLLPDAKLKTIFATEHLSRNILSRMPENVSVKSEEQVFDERLGLAGTIDLLITTNDASRKVWLFDWKTSKVISKTAYGGGFGTRVSTAEVPDANFYKYSLQLGVYAYILQRQGFDVQGLFIEHLTNEGVVEYPVSLETVHLVVAMLLDEGLLTHEEVVLYVNEQSQS